MDKETRGCGVFEGKKITTILEKHLPKHECNLTWEERSEIGNAKNTSKLTFSIEKFVPPERTVDVDSIAELLDNLGYDELEYISKVCEMIKSKMVLDQRV